MKLIIGFSFILVCFGSVCYGQAPKQSESEIYTQINNLYKATKEKDQALLKAKEENRLERVLIEYNMRIQKNELSPAEIKTLKEKLAVTNKKSDEIDKQISENKEEANTFLRMLNMESQKRDKAFTKYLNSVPKDKSIDINKASVIADSDPVQKSVLEKKEIVKGKQSIPEPVVQSGYENLKPNQSKLRTADYYTRYSAANDVYLHPPNKKCMVEYEGIDEFSGKKRKDLVAEPIFFNTPDALKKSLGKRQYIYCTSSLSAITGGTAFLTLNVTIASLDVSKLFGGLEKGSVISIKFLDGENVAIINNRNDFGLIDANAKTTTYRAQCTLGSAIQKILATKEVDKIRITWNAGYEDYEVYDVDLLMRQMNCL
jgi:hypothetical protein